MRHFNFGKIVMIMRFYKWRYKFIKENPILGAYIGFFKGLIIGILICRYLIK